MVKTVYQDALKPIAAFENPIATIATPATGVNNNLLCISADWLPALRGALGVLLEPIHWKGTQEEIDYSIQQISEIIFMANPACECVEYCVTNSTVINNYVQNIQHGDIINSIPNSERLRDLIPPGVMSGGCDFDILYNICVEVVNAIFDATKEIFQRIALASTQAEQVANLLEAIPIVGGVLSLAVDTALWIGNTADAAFFAYDSPTARANFACGLFCIAKSSCMLNFDIVWQAWASKILGDPPVYDSSLSNWLQWLVDVALSGAEESILATVTIMGVLAIKHGGAFGSFALGLRSLEAYIILASNTSDPDWLLLCEPCSTNCYYEETFDLSSEIIIYGSISTEQYRSAPNSLKGDVFASGNGRECEHRINLSGCYINAINAHVWVAMGNPNGEINLSFNTYNASDVLINSGSAFFGGARNTWRNHYIDVDAGNVAYITVRASFTTAFSGTRELYLDDVKIY